MGWKLFEGFLKVNRNHLWGASFSWKLVVHEWRQFNESWSFLSSVLNNLASSANKLIPPFLFKAQLVISLKNIKKEDVLWINTKGLRKKVVVILECDGWNKLKNLYRRKKKPSTPAKEWEIFRYKVQFYMTLFNE